MSENLAALDLIHADTGDIHRCPSARQSSLFGLFMRLQATDPAFHTRRQDLDRITNRKLSVYQSSGDDRAKTWQCEYAINR
jgi:hypothetical protein